MMGMSDNTMALEFLKPPWGRGDTLIMRRLSESRRTMEKDAMCVMPFDKILSCYNFTEYMFL